MRAYKCLALLLCLLVLCACGNTAQPEQQGGGTATVRIVGPEGEELMAAQQVAFSAGETALTALQYAAETQSIQVEVTGGASAYVTAIGGVSAQSNSGWVYTVNGESPTVGADRQKLQDGDVIEWSYVTF